MALSPIIEWRAAASPHAVISSLALTGGGSNGEIIVGNTSSVASVWLTNNFSNTTGVVDATNCTLASYDDALNQGQATSPAVTGLYLGVQVAGYNGNTTNGESGFTPIGGAVKHPISLNNGTLPGSGGSSFQLNLRIIAQSTALPGIISQGLWLEYNASA